MQLTIQYFEPRLERNNLFQDTVTLVFEPKSLKVFSNVNGITVVNKNFFDVEVDINQKEILNKRQNIEFELIEDRSIRKITQKVSLKEMIESSDIENCMRAFLKGKLEGEYTYSNEAVEIINYLEEQNKLCLIDKALEQSDEKLFLNLTELLL